jgi:hypothetical protein
MSDIAFELVATARGGVRVTAGELREDRRFPFPVAAPPVIGVPPD